MDEVNSSSPAISEIQGRDENGKFAKGFSGNPSGRPKNTMKDYLRRKFNDMTDEEKEEWLEQYKVPGEVMWKMAEGNPKQDTDVTSNGNELNAILVKFDDK